MVRRRVGTGRSLGLRRDQRAVPDASIRAAQTPERRALRARILFANSAYLTSERGEWDGVQSVDGTPVLVTRQ
jgi:hypothetical protein